MKAIVLFSGGLDSILALRLMQKQEIEVEALSFFSVFGGREESISAYRRRMEESCARLGAPVTVEDHTESLVNAAQSPAHGYGKNMNPCIDCRIAQLRSAAEHMKRTGASFIATGEVLGQRPMSQRREAMVLIEREAGIEGLVFRPLSAQALKETIPEKEGWVDREDFPAIRGRSRKPQMELAERLGMADLPGSAGGCLLTLPEFAVKVGDCVEHADLTIPHCRLLKRGRHFRASSGAKVVVGRNEPENAWLEQEAGKGDALVAPPEIPGPTALIPGGGSPRDREFAASLCGRYMKVAPGEAPVFNVTVKGEEGSQALMVMAMSPEEGLRFQVGLHRLSPRGKELG